MANRSFIRAMLSRNEVSPRRRVKESIRPTAVMPAPSKTTYELSPADAQALAMADPKYQIALGSNSRNLSSGAADTIAGAQSALLGYGFTMPQIQAMMSNLRDRGRDVIDPITGKALQKFGGDKPIDANDPRFQIDYANVDTSNPFSRAGLLMKSYKASRSGITSSMAAAGQGHSGAAMRAQGRNDYNREQGANAISNAVVGTLGGANSDIVGRYNNFLANNATAMGNANLPTVESITNSGVIPSQGRLLVGNDSKLFGKGVKLANGWRIEYVNGKPTRFIPPGGK